MVFVKGLMSLTSDTVNFCSSVSLDNCADVEGFFQDRQKQNYIPWFNKTLAEQGPWAGVRLVDTPGNDAGFQLFWNRINQIFGGTINLLQFVSLMSILSNEVRANFTPQAEKMGTAGHPGLAYLFDAIPGMKRSYNTLAGGKTAFDCFNDAGYIAAHQAKAGAAGLMQTTDARWKGEVWPSDVLTSSDPAVSGFVMEADFMKFRGRGFIQTTGRANYAALIEFVQNYVGDSQTLNSFQQQWKGKTIDQVASASSNQDWDTLFQHTDLAVAAEAVRAHNANSGGYLALSSDPAILNGNGKGSLFNMGLRIGGGTAYAEKFRDRVGAVLLALQG
jgi:hypothetical protein